MAGLREIRNDPAWPSYKRLRAFVRHSIVTDRKNAGRKATVTKDEVDKALYLHLDAVAAIGVTNDLVSLIRRDLESRGKPQKVEG